MDKKKFIRFLSRFACHLLSSINIQWEIQQYFSVWFFVLRWQWHYLCPSHLFCLFYRLTIVFSLRPTIITAMSPVWNAKKGLYMYMCMFEQRRIRFNRSCCHGLLPFFSSIFFLSMSRHHHQSVSEFVCDVYRLRAQIYTIKLESKINFSNEVHTLVAKFAHFETD